MTRRTRWIVAVVAAVALAAGGIGVWVATRPPDARATADAFLAALERGDGAGALALVAGGVDAAPVAADAFAAARAYPEAARVDDLEIDGAHASVQAHAQLAGARHPVALVLQRDGARWLVDPASLPALIVHTTIGTTARIGGAELTADASARVLPAVYDVHAAPEGIVEGVAESVVAAAREPAEIEVPGALTSDALARAQRELDAYVRACTAPAAEVPRACGLRIPWQADLARAEQFAYRVDRTPTVQISADAREFTASGGDVVVTVTGTDAAGARASATYRDAAWTLRGAVTVDAAGLTLDVR